MKNEVILGSAYLAPVEYYTKLFAYPSVRVERYDHYMKQTYRNRCVIASADGPLALTIPTEKSDDLKCVMKGCTYFRPWQLEACALECVCSRLQA